MFWGGAIFRCVAAEAARRCESLLRISPEDKPEETVILLTTARDIPEESCLAWRYRLVVSIDFFQVNPTAISLAQSPI